MTLDKIGNKRFKGILNYITPYKSLMLKSSEEEVKDLVSELNSHGMDTDEGDNLPYNLSDDGYYYIKVNLNKYEKVQIEKYERMLKSRLLVFVELNKYDNDEYGSGISLKLIKFKKLKTPIIENDDE